MFDKVVYISKRLKDLDQRPKNGAHLKLYVEIFISPKKF